MAPQLSLEQLADLRHDATLLAEQTGAHQQDVNNLVASAERALQQAHTIAADRAHADVTEVRYLLNDHVARSAATATIARQLGVSAREQHGAACRLLAALNVSDPIGRCRPNAVLVVDDYGDTRELVAEVLQNAGFVVRTAVNGLEALIAAYEMRPGVIVMDVAMPVLDGIEATRLIKASEATRDARVIAYTANASLDSTVVNRLFVAVLQKPSAPDVVLSTVQHFASL
jgi:CheY-like chemotaxis protein